MKKEKITAIRTVWLMIILMGMTLTCMAQSPFVKIVKATDSNVALHQKPSALSPVLVYMEDEDGMEGLYLEWASKKNDGEEVDDVSILPVLKEENEWYKVQYEDKTAYVLKVLCKELTQRPLPKDETVLETGEYKGYCFSMEESYGAFAFKIGHYTNGMYVFEYRTWANSYNEGETTMDEENGFNFNVKYSNEFHQPDLSKILADPKMLSYVMSKRDKMRHDETEYLFGVAGDDQVYSVSIAKMSGEK